MRGMGRMVVGSMGVQKMQAQEFLSNRAGSNLTAAMYQNSTGDVLPTATPEASELFMSELNKKSDEEVYQGYVANNYPEIAENFGNTRTAGAEVKRHLQSLPSEVAFSNWQRAQNQGSLPKEGRVAFYQNARDQVGQNRETVTALQKGIYTPTLDTLDASPRFAIDTFNTNTVTEKGAVANAKIFTGVKHLGIQENRQEGVKQRRAETTFYKASSAVLGQKFAQASGVKLTAKEQQTYGCAMAKIRNVVVKRNPTLAKNMAYHIMGDGKVQFTSLMADEKFTSQAVQDMKSQQTSAWLANTLNVKQKDISTPEHLFKTKPKTPTTIDNTSLSVRHTSSQVIQPKPQKSKPVELIDLQKREYESEPQW
jgi:hypothetical protein